MSTCRSCGARIVWGKTARGKAIPLDEQTELDGNVELLADRTAIVHAQPPITPAGTLHRPHHMTCPDGDQWRNR